MQLSMPLAWRLLAWLTMSVAAWAAPNQRQQPGGELARQITATMHELRGAVLDCAWQDVLRLWAVVQELVPRGSDAWFEACAGAVKAHAERWEPEAILPLAREAMAAAVSRQRPDPRAPHAAQPPLGPLTRSHLARIEIAVARVAQSRSEHERALRYLGGLIADLRERPCADAHVLLARAGQAAGRSLSYLDRTAEARQALESLRDDMRGSIQGAVACVLLQQGEEGVDAYRGKFEGDPLHRERMLALQRALPPARARLAARLHRSEAELPRFPVGVADAPAAQSDVSALTSADARVPDFLPVITVFSEALALELIDAEQVLVHELTHALLIEELGRRHEGLPAWIIEGIPQGLAGQWDRNADLLLSRWLIADPEGFLRPDFWSRHDLAPSNDPCGRAFAAHDGLLLSALERLHGEGRLLHLVDNLHSQRSERAFSRIAGGSSPGQFARVAEKELRSFLEARRQASIPVVESILAAGNEGPQAVLAATERTLSANPPPVARGLAMWQRAAALELLERRAEALEAYDALRGPEHAGFAETLRVGRARCLLGLGRREEAARELADLRRAGFSTDLVQWATDKLAELEGQRER